jgi:hypothetical protein
MEKIKSDYEILMDYAEDYQDKNNELAIIRNEKASAILVLMADSKSCKEAEYKWSAEPRGQRETILVYYLKGLEKKMSSLRAKINSERSY